MDLIDKSQTRLELLLLGTGTSSQVPSIACLTEPNGNGCQCCKSLDKKNQRRNTSAIIRIHRNTQNCHQSDLNTLQVVPNQLDYCNLDHKDGPSAIFHILIDVGKSFCEAAREHFPKNKIRKIDAVLLTHPHADAVNGLDDLRAWTLRGVIQKSISIYCNQYTYSEISKMYPYLVNSDAKTGGGDVPEFDWHIIQDGKPFEISGIQVTPLPVHHGKYFGPESPGKPYICLSYLIERSVYYVSDVSEIPQTTMEFLKNKFKPGDDQLKVLIIDTLNLYGHPSHFGISQAVRAAKMLNSHRTYLVGFTHRVSHDCWVYCCKAISEGKKSTDFLSDLNCDHPDGEDRRRERKKLVASGTVEDFDWFTNQSLTLIEASQSKPPFNPRQNCTAANNNWNDNLVWVRPGFDGLLIRTTDHPSFISDNFYDL